MANLPENTTNPILRPVTQLEITNKVYGGEYIPDDEQQRGVSNLQAIELAERDQYIISRVGQAKIDPSGDIPGEPGIASLDTNGKIPDAQIPTTVTKNTAVQTLTNKTIDKASNTVTCSPTVIDTETTLVPTKEMNVVISAPLNLSSGAQTYIGLTIPVTATAATTVTYVSANGTVTDNLDAGQTVNYIWKGAYWGSVSNASLPVFISTTQTVEPTMDMNYVVDTASVVLTVDSGAYIGHKVSVTATANCSVAYLGADGATTLAIAQYYRAELTWNGSYWLVELFAVVEGLDAQGNPFEYGGAMSIASAPKAYSTITTDGATLDPTVNTNFILNIGSSGASCSLDSGAAVFQSVTVANTNSYAVLVTFEGANGTHTRYLTQNEVATFVWLGTYWTAGDYITKRPPIGIPTLWMAAKPTWALNFGDGSSTKYAWSDYPELDTPEFRAILDVYKATGGSNLCSDYDGSGFYVPDLRGMMLRATGTNGKGYSTDAIANVGAVKSESLPNFITSYGYDFAAATWSTYPSSGQNGPWTLTSATACYNITYDSSATERDRMITVKFNPANGSSIYSGSHVSPLSVGAMYIVRFM